MKKPLALISSILIGVGSLFAPMVGAMADSSPSVTEFPTAGVPLSITTGPDGSQWYTEIQNNNIAHISSSGAITEYPVPTPSAAPYDITNGPDGAMWFTERNSPKIGRITTAGVITEFNLPSPTTGYASQYITSGPDGALWFTEFNTNAIGRMTVTGAYSQYDLGVATPTGITVGPDGALWFGEYNANKIGRLTTTMLYTDYTLPTAGAYPIGITTGPDGSLWFTELVGNKIGKVATTGTFGAVTEYAIPTDTSEPIRITNGPDGALWFTENNGNNIGRITTSGAISEYPVPTAFAEASGIDLGSDGALWFAESNGNKIGRLALTAPDTTPPVLGAPSFSSNHISTGQSTTLTLPASDAGSGVATGEYYIGSTDPGQGNGTAMSYASGNISASLGSSLSAGSYTVNARAKDVAGNWSDVTSATLTVVNPAQTIGSGQQGTTLDGGDANFMNGTKFTTGSVGGTATQMSAYVGAVDASPNNHYQMSIYTTKANGKPGTLVAQTAVGSLTANSLNTLSISASLAANTQYWLMYNTNATQTGLNDMYYTVDEQGIGAFAARTFGTWPASFPNGASSTDQKFSLSLSYTPSGAVPSSPTPLAGDSAVENNIDSNTAGTAEAFQYTANANGTANSLQVYLNATSAASQVVIGLYSDQAGAPHALLGQATISAPIDGAWNSAALPASANIVSGTKYWIAILGPRTQGVVGFRDVASGGVGSRASSQSNLTSLPVSWTDGATFATSSLSAFVY